MDQVITVKLSSDPLVGRKLSLLAAWWASSVPSALHSGHVAAVGVEVCPRVKTEDSKGRRLCVGQGEIHL